VYPIAKPFKIAVPSHESSDEDDVPLAQRNRTAAPSKPAPMNQESSDDEDDKPLSQKVECKKRVGETKADQNSDDDVPLSKRVALNARKPASSSATKPIKQEIKSDSDDEVPLVREQQHFQL